MIKKIIPEKKEVILVWSMAILIICSSLVASFFYARTGQMIKQKFEYEKGRNFIDSCLQDINSQVTFLKKYLTLLSQEEEAFKALNNRDESSLADANLQLDSACAILSADVCYLIDRNGIVIASSNRKSPKSFMGKNYGFRPYFKEAVKGNTFVYLALGVTSQKKGVYLSTPIYSEHNRKISGVLVIKVNSLHLFGSQLKNKADNMVVNLVAPQGMIFDSSDSSYVLKWLWKPAPDQGSKAEKSRQFGKGPWPWSGLTKESQNYIVKDMDGHSYHFFKKNIEGLPGWSLVVLHSNKDAVLTFFDFLKDMEHKFLVLIALLIIFSMTLFICIITQKEINKRYASSEELKKLSAAVEHSSVLVVITDIKGDITYVNPKFEEVTGYSAREAIGQNPRILNAGVQSKSYYEDFWNTILSGKDWHGEMCNKKKDGSIYWEMAYVAPIFNEKNQISHFVAVEEDITEAKALVDQLKEAKTNAETANKYKTDFLSNMSHEIRTPLNGIIGMVELLNQTVLSKDQQGYVDKLKNSGENLLELINNILDISKIEEGKFDIVPVPFLLHELIRQTIDSFSVPALQKNLQIEYKIENNVPESVSGDETRIRQVLTNLLANAVKFTEKGSITLKIMPDPRYQEGQSKISKNSILFEIKDTGAGIPESEHSAIFEQFRQADGSITRQYGGTGLGLAICKKIIEKMGGTIWVKSTPNVGSTFYFNINLPRCEQKPLKQAQSCQVIFPSCRVLVAEDNEINQEVITGYLNRMECIITCVGNGEEAIEAFENQDFDLILMDIQMPKMDGETATRHIRQSSHSLKKIPIIAMTAHAFSEDRQRFLNAGMDDFISKPIKFRELTRLIKKVCCSQKKIVKKADHKISSSPTAPGHLTDNKNEQEIFNTNKALQLLGNDADLLKTIYESALNRLPGYCKDLLYALKNMDQEDVRQKAHKLKGSAGSLGAFYLETLCKKIEHEKKLSEKEYRYYHHKIEKVCDETVVAIKSYLNL